MVHEREQLSVGPDEPIGGLTPPPAESPAAERLRHALSQLRSRLNQRLAPLGLRVSAPPGSARWHLRTQNDLPFEVALGSTPWQAPPVSSPRPPEPTPLTPMLRAIWEELRAVSPAPVSWEALARRLGLPESKHTSTRISDAVHRLQRRLRGSSGAAIYRPEPGLYLLIADEVA
ncbi:MAG: hypothetical protein R3F60_27310 [bacterium]